MNLENGLKKAKDHVLKKSSCTMKKKFEELKELSEFDTMLKSSIDDFECELSKVLFFQFLQSLQYIYMVCVSFSRYLKLLIIIIMIQAMASVWTILMPFS